MMIIHSFATITLEKIFNKVRLMLHRVLSEELVIRPIRSSMAAFVPLSLSHYCQELHV